MLTSFIDKNRKNRVMIKVKTKYLIQVLAISILFLCACQEDVVIITNPENENAIGTTSPLADLVRNTAMNDGSFDNILDNSSCTSIALPVSVIANQIEITINTVEDYKLVERVFDESSTDVDVLVFVYPITVIMADFTEVTASNEEELEDLIEDCVEGGDDIDIECLDFAYPITVSVYDSANQVSDVVTLNNDEDLFKFFEALDENELVSFDFPLIVYLSDSTEVTIENNNELEEIIEEVAEECDEDDDNDYNDDDIDDSVLVDALLNGEWAVSYFFDEADETTDFQGFVFTFFEDGSAKTIKDDLVINGTWETYGDDGSLEIEIDFGSESPMDELEEDWNIIEFNDSIIKLSDDETLLTFERSTDNGGGINEPTFSQILIEGQWTVANYSDAGVDETANYQGFKLTFNMDGTVAATNDTDTVNGTWSEIIDGDKHKMELDFGATVPFDEFAEDWIIVNITETRVELNDINEDQSVDTLVFEKL